MHVVFGNSGFLANDFIGMCNFNKRRTLAVSQRSLEIVEYENGNQKVVFKCSDEYELMDLLVDMTAKHDLESMVFFIGDLINDLAVSFNEEKFQKMIEINFLIISRFVKKMIPKMILQKSGRVVVISSTSAEHIDKGRFSYGASKRVLEAYIQHLSMEVGRFGITCNAVVPGLIESPMLRENSKPNSITNEVSKLALPNLGKASDVTSLVDFLVSGNSTYITGQLIRVDGGRLN